MNSGGGGRSGRGPIRIQEQRKDHRNRNHNGSDHRFDGCDPDSEVWP